MLVIFEPAEGGGTPRGPYASAMIEARRISIFVGWTGYTIHDVYAEFFARLFSGGVDQEAGSGAASYR